jgi:GNAT superfamily N-acetyltransferase
MTMDVTLRPLTAEAGPACADMTFPTYRHLLQLEPAPRHPDQGDTRVIRPFGIVAEADGAPAGLVLAETPLEDDKPPEILSVFVRPAFRNEGIATALLGAVEDVLREGGFPEVQAVYMTGKPGIDALERVLAKRAWTTPETRTVTLRFTPEQARKTPWYGRIRLGPGYELFPWSEVGKEEREEAMRTQEQKAWIAPPLAFWLHDCYGFDPVSSLGLRHHGKLAGWVINHRVSADTVRFTCSYMRKDLGRRGRIMPLYTASLERLDPGTTCLFVTPVCYGTMVSFVRTRCAPWATFFGETKGSTKRLSGAVPEAPRG